MATRRSIVGCVRLAGAFAVVALVGSATTSTAQDASTYYTVMHPGEFTIKWKVFYDNADRMTAETRKELPTHLAIAYGPDPKQKLDIYQPKEKGAPGAVFIFLHGGGFREGDRAQYGWIARPFAKRGVVTVVASYRLLPTFSYPSQPEDARNLIAWTYRNIKKYGGDPNRIFIGGHSAGAILSATVGVRRDWTAALSLPPDVLKGFVPVSGSYDVTTSQTVAQYVPDPAKRAEASPLLNVETPFPPAIIAVGSPERQLAGSRALADKLKEKGGKSNLIVLEGLEHDATALAIADESSPLCQAILALIAGK